MTDTPGVKPYLDQQLHVLVDEDMRAFTLGLADLRAEQSGRKPIEGDAVRELLSIGISRWGGPAGLSHDEIKRRGRAELERRKIAARGE